MIRYALICGKGHSFESWFQSSAAYDKQAKHKLVSCPICGNDKVEKEIMSPRLAGTRKRNALPAPQAADAGGGSDKAPGDRAPGDKAPGDKAPVAMISPQERELRAKLKDLRDHITKNADYVGQKFPDEARKMHYGEIDHRSIYGEASADEARKLHEEGIEFHPLPVLPDERN